MWTPGFRLCTPRKVLQSGSWVLQKGATDLRASPLAVANAVTKRKSSDMPDGAGRDAGEIMSVSTVGAMVAVGNADKVGAVVGPAVRVGECVCVVGTELGPGSLHSHAVSEFAEMHTCTLWPLLTQILLQEKNRSPVVATSTRTPSGVGFAFANLVASSKSQPR